MPFVMAEVWDVTSNSAILDFEFTGGDAEYARYRPLRLTISGTSYSNRVFDSYNKGGANSYWTINVSGLQPDTTYSVSAQLGYYTDAASTQAAWLSLYATGSFTTAKATTDVALWSWSKSNGSATATQTRNAYDILQGERTADDFSCKVWNDLVDKASEVRGAKGYTWDTVNGKYLSASNCKVSSGDVLSAKVYNSVRYNLGSIESVGFADVSPGDELTGYHITRLADVINSIIGKL